MFLNYLHYLIHNHQTNTLPMAFKEYFRFRNEIHSKIPRYNMDLHIPQAKINYGYTSIKVLGVKVNSQKT